MTAEQKLKIQQEKIALKAAKAAERDLSMMKIVVIFCLINGVAWVWCSYILAFNGYTEIAESLSQVALAEIIGVILTYAIKSLVENLSKHNCWPDKILLDTPQPTESSTPSYTYPSTADTTTEAEKEQVSEVNTEYSFEGSVGYDNSQEDYTGG